MLLYLLEAHLLLDNATYVTKHGVSFSRACLPIHEYGAIYAVEGTHYDLFTGVIVNFVIVVAFVEAVICTIL